MLDTIPQDVGGRGLVQEPLCAVVVLPKARQAAEIPLDLATMGRFRGSA